MNNPLGDTEAPKPRKRYWRVEYFCHGKWTGIFKIDPWEDDEEPLPDSLDTFQLHLFDHHSAIPSDIFDQWDEDIRANGRFAFKDSFWNKTKRLRHFFNRFYNDRYQGYGRLIEISEEDIYIVWEDPDQVAFLWKKEK